MENTQLIVNATSAGMYPQVDHSPWPDGLNYPDAAVIYDLVYNPKETRLMRNAGKAGLETASGIGMLIEQAALSFKYWTEHSVDMIELRDMLEDV